MHTGFQLKDELFDIVIDGEPAGLDELFPDWDLHDRLGVIITEPVGALGASLMIQAAITRYFNHRRENVEYFRKLLEPAGEKEAVAAISEGLEGWAYDSGAKADKARIAFPVYADVYALHVGRRHGSHSGFDIWPSNREPVVDNDFAAISAAVNDYGITRLLVPEGVPDRRDDLDFEVRAALRERLQSIFVYSSGGDVENADITIRGTDPVTEQNPNTILTFATAVAAVEKMAADEEVEARKRELMRNLEIVRPRVGEVSGDIMAEIRQKRADRLVDGVATESYRRATLQQALDLIAAIPS